MEGSFSGSWLMEGVGSVVEPEREEKMKIIPLYLKKKTPPFLLFFNIIL
jgi:hypothetical protein